MWVSHFSALFDAALENEGLHILEHASSWASALLFWWPVIGADPAAASRLSHPIRVGYLFIGMPWSSFLGLAIFSAQTVLYAHYATLARDWGPTPLEDQQLAGGIMWVVGDAIFLVGADPGRRRPGCAPRTPRDADSTLDSIERRPRPGHWPMERGRTLRSGASPRPRAARR